MKTCDNCKHKNKYGFGEQLHYCQYCSIGDPHPLHTDNWKPLELTKEERIKMTEETFLKAFLHIEDIVNNPDRPIEFKKTTEV